MSRILLALALIIGCSEPKPHGPADAGVRKDAAAPRDASVPVPDAPITDAAPQADAGIDAGTTTLRPWRARPIYLAMTDRFWNGDTANDDRGAANCFDPASTSLFHGGDFAGLRDKAAYLEELGVGALWVTPAYKQIARAGSSCGYHGYWADFTDPDDGALEEKLGSAADLEALIAELHRRDMRFILDMVVNHSGRATARILGQHPDWFHQTASCAGLGDPTIYCPLNGLPDFAQENPAVAGYLRDQSVSWVQRFALDGIRMDTVKHVSPGYFRDTWVPGVRAARDGLFLVGEVFNEGSVADLSPALDNGFDSAFHFPLRRAFISTFALGGSVDLVASQVADTIGGIGLERALDLVTLLDNHDVPRFVSEMDGVAPDEQARRYLLALCALFTLPGIPQLYYGNELGLAGRSPQNRRDMPAWAFNPPARAAAHDGFLPRADQTFEHVRTLGRLRREHAALSDGGYVELWRKNSGQANVLAFLRSRGESRVLVVLNAGGAASGPMRIPIQTHPRIAAADKAALVDGTPLETLLGAAGATLQGGALAIDLPARGFAIYRPR